ncbi:TetR/AcrR family transcriptional regulator [Paenalkalicoccus suaedae]|uniref:TetR/AcrR family transcriptional regulator n=1 Tax=Paenalkalicoccus suaedae TaxID=2592382 RepID=A0A859FHA6_9BACI|nr:TetR/AcrR family transcriptional regulator [Paenalkalicoccus suaedae]QKS72451.1 TetR/AcrR family transcriptional regulator [Paenalkalicoccus suaedae]
MPSESFTNLPEEKQHRIINAAMNVFIEDGFDKTSTNSIVKEAHISKGSLFHYFGTKKDLYLYIVDLSIEQTNELYDLIDLKERDFFKRIDNIVKVKYDYQNRYPLLNEFILASLREQSTEVAPTIQPIYAKITQDSLAITFENIDWSLFKPEIDQQKAMEIIQWTLDGLGKKLLATAAPMTDLSEEAIKEWKEYSKILRSSFYTSSN